MGRGGGNKFFPCFEQKIKKDHQQSKRGYHTHTHTHTHKRNRSLSFFSFYILKFFTNQKTFFVAECRDRIGCGLYFCLSCLSTYVHFLRFFLLLTRTIELFFCPFVLRLFHFFDPSFFFLSGIIFGPLWFFFFFLFPQVFFLILVTAPDVTICSTRPVLTISTSYINSWPIDRLIVPFISGQGHFTCFTNIQQI